MTKPDHKARKLWRCCACGQLWPWHDPRCPFGPRSARELREEREEVPVVQTGPGGDFTNVWPAKGENDGTDDA